MPEADKLAFANGVSNTVKFNADQIASTLDKLRNSSDVVYTALKSAMQTAVGSDRVMTVVAIAGVLAAAWFAPVYVAGAVEFLYPIVYNAMFGIPSKLGWAYWTVYYPGKMHAVAWAYSNSGAIIALGGSALSILKNFLPARAGNNDQNPK